MSRGQLLRRLGWTEDDATSVWKDDKARPRKAILQDYRIVFGVAVSGRPGEGNATVVTTPRSSRRGRRLSGAARPDTLSAQPQRWLRGGFSESPSRCLDRRCHHVCVARRCGERSPSDQAVPRNADVGAEEHRLSREFDLRGLPARIANCPNDSATVVAVPMRDMFSGGGREPEA